ncbi:MAG: hypothetical protein HC856_02095 [Pseudanabaena sp. RU_4_16]|nr:hypothetical protein [Pseudanabaena sp. RU_4_16]
MKISKFFSAVFLVSLISLVAPGCASKPPIDSEPISIDPPPVTSDRQESVANENSDRQQFLQPRCVKWADFKQAVKEKRISLDSPIPELPSNFREGCLLADRGIYTLVIYVFANSTDVKRLPINQRSPSLYRDLYAIIPPVEPYFNVPDLPVDRRLKYMRIFFDSPNRSNSLDLNKPQAWKGWERPYVRNAVNIFYHAILVDSHYLNREEVVRLLEATKDLWSSPSAPTIKSAHTSNFSTCSLKNWNLLDPYGEVTFTIAVTNRSKRKQQILAIELEILDKEGNDLRTLSNPYRRYQGWTFGFEPPLRDRETREVEGFRKYMVGWHQVKLKRCQWLNSSEQYRQLYPEINNIYFTVNSRSRSKYS